MKKLLNEWKKHLKEINEGDNSAKCASHMTHLKSAHAAHKRGDERAFQEIQYQTEKMKALKCDMNKDYNKPEDERRYYAFSDKIKELAEDIFIDLSDAGHVEWSKENEADFLEKFDAFIEEYKEEYARKAAAEKAAEEDREDF